ncbi:MAG: Ig-like domain-containing protein [Muribaculaceae bacterium]|nr:Ig-like domain-containing protein [Muribaculaceae bacterium]
MSVTLKEKEIFQLIATISPENATDKIVWSSSNDKVATVSEDGLVTGVSLGQATITATCGYISATCTVVVTEENGVENIISDENSSYSVYTVDGRLVKNNCKKQELEYLPKGIYIIVSEKGHYKISI